jgi:nucleoside-diphosphate-sugar epimerase
MAGNVALVAGALGVVGRALIEHLDTLDGWQAIGLSRRAPDFASKARFVGVDLLDADDCKAKLGDLGDVTHIFFCAYTPRPHPAEEVAPNKAMLVNLVDTVAAAAPGLRHVHLVTGSKWYGNHLGPYKTPSREDDPRHMGPNFYYDQQDWLEARAAKAPWSWSSTRPHGVCGLSVGSAMNQLTGLAVYGTISKALGLPLRWPGKPGAFEAVYQVTDTELLAKGMLWAATTPAAADQAFNMTNGDFVRWCNIWPGIAEFFGLAPGPVQTISLADFMADKEPLWAEIRARHGLRDYKIAELTNWRFVDFVYGCEYDQMSTMVKARAAGWNDFVDSQFMYPRLLQRLRRDKIIP